MKHYHCFLLLLPILFGITGCKNHEDAGREGFLNFYAINDYHGRISSNDQQGDIGISKISSFLNEQKFNHELEYVFLNAGDLWQDTYESNQNKGACLTEAMEVMGCEAMELGNHEFDWGLDTIKENKSNASKCEYLGANIYYFDNSLGVPTTQANDIASPYKIIERNGFKIGVIGIIGKGQITSITSSNWENLTFVDPLSIVEHYSDELRIEKQCDLVVLLAHASTGDLSEGFCNEVTSINEDTSKPFIDCCFTAHTHVLENKEYNGVPFVQGGSKGKNVSHIEFDMRKDKPVVTKHEQLVVETKKTDRNIDKIVNKYITRSFKKIRDEKVFTVETKQTISTVDAGRLQAYATYEYLKHIEQEKNITITAVFNNGGRDSVDISETSGVLTREMIFNLTPFTNKTYVAKVSGANILVAMRNFRYFAPVAQKIEQTEYYYIACIDYVLLHKDTTRRYDNFSSYDGNPAYIENVFPDQIITSVFKGKTLEKAFFSDKRFNNLY